MLRWSVGTCWTLPSRGGEASTPSGQSSPGSARGDLTPHLPLLRWEEPRRVQNAGAGRGFGEPPVQPRHLTEGETEAWRRNGIFQSHTAQPWSDGVWSGHCTLLNPPPLAKRLGWAGLAPMWGPLSAPWNFATGCPVSLSTLWHPAELDSNLAQCQVQTQYVYCIGDS